MKQKTVVISCVPGLSLQQEAGMLQLLQDLEARGVKPYLYMLIPTQLLEAYRVQKLKYNKFNYRYNYYKTLLRMNRAKWSTRVQEYYETQPGVATNRLLKQKLKEALRFLCTVKPDLFVCWNAYSAAHGLVAVAAQHMGIPVAGIEWGLLPETFVLDPQGVLASSVVFNNPIDYTDTGRLLQQGDVIYNDLKNKSISLYAQAAKPLPEALLTKAPYKTRILLLGIEMLDAGAIPETDPDRKGLLPFHTSNREQSLAFAAADPDFVVVLKPHPSHNYDKEDQQLADNCWILNIDPELLMNWADVVVCSGSKLELSVLLKNKPLVNVGAGVLYKKCCSYEIHQPNELREKVLEAKSNGFTPEQLTHFKTFLGYLHVHYLYSYAAGAQNHEVVDRLLTVIN